MKTFLFIAIAVSMCDSCERTSSEKSSLKSFGITEERDAPADYDSSDINSRDSLPEYELPEPQLKLSFIENEQDRKIPARNLKIYYYRLN